MKHAPFLKKGRVWLMATLLVASAMFFSPAMGAEGIIEIRLLVGGEILPALLEDNAASRDFLEMLPLTLTMKDYNETEKIGGLPRKLSTAGIPGGFEPAVGDLTFYAPWGNIALFYRDFSWSNGLIRLGRITSGIEKLAAMRGDFTITFERANPVR